MITYENKGREVEVWVDGFDKICHVRSPFVLGFTMTFTCPTLERK